MPGAYLALILSPTLPPHVAHFSTPTFRSAACGHMHCPPPSVSLNLQVHCKSGHCGSLVKILKGNSRDAAMRDGRRAAAAAGHASANPLVSRIGKRLKAFDALEAGAFIVYTSVFDVLHRCSRLLSGPFRWGPHRTRAVQSPDLDSALVSRSFAGC